MDSKLNKQIERRKLILSGNIWKTILIICFPIALYQFINSLSTVVDQIITANISPAASNAVGSIAQLKNCLSAFGAGLASGGAVLVARFYGAGNLKEARHISGNILLLSLILSASIILIFLPLAVPLMRLCQISETAISIGSTYFRLQLFELVFVSINSIFIGLEKAKGNSRLILFLNLLILGLKIALTALFVYVFKVEDIAYIELATIISQVLLSIIGLILIFKKSNILKVSLSDLKPKASYMKDILILSIPIFFGKFVMNIGKVSVNAIMLVHLI